MQSILGLAALLLGLPAVANAGPFVVPAENQPVSPPTCIVPPDTQIDFEIVDHLGSKISRTGDRFRIRAFALTDGAGHVLIPEGAMGEGEVIHAARARAGGKAGELILSARHVECGEKRITLRRFRFGQKGSNETGSAIAVSLLAGPLGYLVVGGEVDVQPRTAGHATIADIVSPGAADAGRGPTNGGN